MKYQKYLMSAALTAVLMSTASTALAQSSVDVITDEIFVTATKKTDVENVQTVPIAITAFGADTLEALKVRDLEGLSFSTPNVTLDDVGTTRGTANFSIRGLGINSSIPSIDPTVGVFVDGIYLGINSGVVFDVFDLDSVEVLRGPQGLLFGRNTTGGAVLLNTGNPTDELKYSFRAAIDGPIDSGRGGANTYLQGVVSGPIVKDKLNFKIGAYTNNDSGYFTNLATNERHGQADTQIYRGALEWFAAPEVTFLAKLELFQSEGDGPAGQNTGVYERDTFDFAIDNPGSYDNDALTASLRTDWDIAFGNGTITNIAGYRQYRSETNSDIDALPFVGFHAPAEIDQSQFSNELRYNGQFGAANVTTGVYFFEQEAAYTEVRMLPPLSPLTFYGGGIQDHTVLGAFGQVDYDLSDKFTLTAGLRYSHETKDADVTFVRPRNTCSVVDGTCPVQGTNALLSLVTGGLVNEANGFSDSNSWSNLTPKVGAEYRHSDNLLGYASYTKGFRSGGYNFRITDANVFAAQVAQTGSPGFDEEKVDAFEVGAKFNSSDRRAQLNLAGFYTDISNMQREVNISSPTAGVSQFILNTADASILGVEAEGHYKVMDNLLLTGNVGVIDASYDRVIFDISGDGVVNAADEALDLPRVPELTFGFGVVHDLDMGDSGMISSRIAFQHRDRIAYTDSNFGFVQAADMVNGNITWHTPAEGVSISLYGKNLLDEVQAGGDTQVPFGGPLSNGVNAPYDPSPAAGTFRPLKKGRVIGLELTIKN
ncbi:MAG: TonB-dependent receptor [Alphaproteobacteria bacterium]